MWAVKHDFIGNVYFDEAASAFFLPKLFERLEREKQRVGERIQGGEKSKYGLSGGESGGVHGSALGPDWTQHALKNEVQPLFVLICTDEY